MLKMEEEKKNENSFSTQHHLISKLCYIFLKTNESHTSFSKYLEHGKKFESVSLLVVTAVWTCGIKRMSNFSATLDVRAGDFGYTDYFGIAGVKCPYTKYHLTRLQKCKVLHGKDRCFGVQIKGRPSLLCPSLDLGTDGGYGSRVV